VVVLTPLEIMNSCVRKVWNKTLCMLDSDGDGRTNGEELGDPECVWIQGAASTNGLSHPGYSLKRLKANTCGVTLLKLLCSLNVVASLFTTQCHVIFKPVY